jgi:hypothetical protein
MPHSHSNFCAGDIGRKSNHGFAGAQTRFRRSCLRSIIAVLLGLILVLAKGADSPPSSEEGQKQREKIHFLECLAFVYDPAMWLSYQGNLYFTPRTDDQVERLGQMKKSREQYVALTNRLERYQMVANAIARSGIGEQWQKKILLPYSETNQDLTPTRKLTMRWLPKYQVLRTLSGGDALLADDSGAVFVMDFGRAADDARHTKATLIKEGMKSFKSQSGEYVQMEAFTDAGLNHEEIAIFQQVVREFANEAAALASANSPTLAAATNQATHSSEAASPDTKKPK